MKFKKSELLSIDFDKASSVSTGKLESVVGLSSSVDFSILTDRALEICQNVEGSDKYHEIFKRFENKGVKVESINFKEVDQLGRFQDLYSIYKAITMEDSFETLNYISEVVLRLAIRVYQGADPGIIKGCYHSFEVIEKEKPLKDTYNLYFSTDRNANLIPLEFTESSKDYFERNSDQEYDLYLNRFDVEVVRGKLKDAGATELLNLSRKQKRSYIEGFEISEVKSFSVDKLIRYLEGYLNVYETFEVKYNLSNEIYGITVV